MLPVAIARARAARIIMSPMYESHISLLFLVCHRQHHHGRCVSYLKYPLQCLVSICGSLGRMSVLVVRVRVLCEQVVSRSMQCMCLRRHCTASCTRRVALMMLTWFSRLATT